jgi:hypothetical protein
MNAKINEKARCTPEEVVVSGINPTVYIVRVT